MLNHASLYGLCVEDRGPSSWIVSVNSMLAPARTAEMSAVTIQQDNQHLTTEQVCISKTVSRNQAHLSTVSFISVSGQIS